MKIIITGNLGYVGPVVVKQLRSTYPNAELIGIDSGFFAHNLTDAAQFPEVRLNQQIFGDVRTVDGQVFNGADAVVHLAAISNDPMGNQFEQITHEINYLASIRIAELAKAAGVRHFVFASSCSIYGFAEGGPRDEQSPVNPLTAYAKSKVQTEVALQALADDRFVVTALRFATACGMSPRLRLDLVLNDFVASAVATQSITILSDGTPWRPLIAVSDMARAIEWAVTRVPGNTPFLAINAGSDTWNYQVKELAQAVSAVFGQVEVNINPTGQPDKRSYKVSFDLFKSLAPNHQPVATLDGEIRALKTGLETISFNNPNFRNSSFMRLKVLTAHLDNGLLQKELKWN